jgi:DNA polymerase-3 subunit gamma/tau
MFENVIGQPVIERITSDLEAGVFPPSILFYGPAASAKGSAALELARVLSCEASPAFDRQKTAKWNCGCPACARHRSLAHLDLLALGPRLFQAEIAACQAVFLRDTGNAAGRMLFIRAVRKLLLRFAPPLWEGDSKIARLNKILETVSENMDALDNIEAASDAAAGEKTGKICEKIKASCAELESEALSGVIPAANIRNAAYWLRMAPNGRRKTLIIENAEKMNDAARNSLLKILEEPPETASIILVTTRPKVLLPTLLSRLRPYHFVKRGAQEEEAVLKRIFRQEPAPPGEGNAVLRFLNGFLPVSRGNLAPAAAYYAASLAACAILEARRARNAPPDETLAAIGLYCAPLAHAAGFAKHDTAVKTIVSVITKTAFQFEPRSLFPLFISLFYETLSAALGKRSGAKAIACRVLARKYAEEAQSAVEVYNQSPVLALERMTAELCRAFADAV